MSKEILIERMPGQTRLAVLEDKRLCEMYCERQTRKNLSGCLFVGRVHNILPGMNAAFVDIGQKRNAYLSGDDLCVDSASAAEIHRKLSKSSVADRLRPGQLIICQVTKEPGGNKGARITQNIALPGRLCVFLPTIAFHGVSKKIENEAERNRLNALAEKLISVHSCGLILRTAAEQVSEEDISAEFTQQLSLWRDIQKIATTAALPGEIYSNADLCLYAIRDLMREDVDQIRTDSIAVYERLKDYARSMTPGYLDKIVFYETGTPLFDLKRIDHQFEEAFRHTVELKSGATLVIDETEAMTVIDVNSARFVGKNDQQQTLFQTNMDAAQEIVRQIRLRDLGGIIIVDFIDMNGSEHKNALLNRLRELFLSDRNRTEVVGMTALGLVEITRKKVRPPVSRQYTQGCRECGASGRQYTAETWAYLALRELWRRRRSGDNTAYTVNIHSDAAAILEELLSPELGNVNVCADGHRPGYELSIRE